MSSRAHPLVLVTGGTGFAGRSVVRELVSSGYRVRVLTRPGQPVPEAREEVEWWPADLYDPAQVTEACKGVRSIIHLVGIIHESFAAPFEKVHVEGTRSVLTAAARAGVTRYIHMSALGTRPHARSQYHRTKWDAEELVRASGLDWTIFRPSIVFGPGDGFVNLFARFLTFPLNFLQAYLFPLLGGGQNRLQPIAVRNVAEAFVRSLPQETAIGRHYDLCGREPMTFAFILQEIARATQQSSCVEVWPVQTVARLILWFLCLALPLAWVAVLLLQGGQTALVALVLVWLIALSAAWRWRRLIFFALPWPLAFLVAALLQHIWIRGQPLLTVDQVIMLQEDNVGDFEPATTAFRLELIGFAPGIREYL